MDGDDRTQRFLVTTAAGLEGLLLDELTELGLEPTASPGGPVVVNGDFATAAVILLRSRIASSLLLSLRRFSARHSKMLYDQVRRIDWPKLFPASFSIAVKAYGSTEGTDYAISFAPLRIKDAIVDEYRYHAGGVRPDVDRHDPDVRVAAFFFNGRCELSVDLAGIPLHRRGYRREGAAAPLRENRAAALLRFAGYDGAAPLLDPFCGSGTIPIEAALIARRIAPGLLRPADGFAASRLYPDSVEPLAAERRRAEGERLSVAGEAIAGIDIDPTSIEIARGNAEKAGVADAIRFETGDAREAAPSGGWVVSNPPYGERLSDTEAAIALLGEFVRRLKHNAAGTRLALVLPRGPLEKSVGLKPSKRLAVESGPLGLRFLLFELYAGSRRGTKTGGTE